MARCGPCLTEQGVLLEGWLRPTNPQPIWLLFMLSSTSAARSRFRPDLLPIHRDRFTDLQGYVASTGQPVPSMTELHHKALSIGLTALETGLLPLAGRGGVTDGNR